MRRGHGCVVCLRRFKRRYHLKRHMMSFHPSAVVRRRWGQPRKVIRSPSLPNYLFPSPPRQPCLNNDCDPSDCSDCDPSYCSDYDRGYDNGYDGYDGGYHNRHADDFYDPFGQKAGVDFGYVDYAEYDRGYDQGCKAGVNDYEYCTGVRPNHAFTILHDAIIGQVTGQVPRADLRKEKTGEPRSAKSEIQQLQDELRVLKLQISQLEERLHAMKMQ